MKLNLNRSPVKSGVQSLRIAGAQRISNRLPAFFRLFRGLLGPFAKVWNETQMAGLSDQIKVRFTQPDIQWILARNLVISNSQAADDCFKQLLFRSGITSVHIKENCRSIHSKIIFIFPGSWKDEDDFGMDRPTILFDVHGCDPRTKQELFEAVVSRLAIAYDQIPGKYPLYIRLSEADLDLIAQASHLGFIPYFGKWAKKTPEQSEKSWQAITDSLRTRYPQGLNA